MVSVLPSEKENYNLSTRRYTKTDETWLRRWVAAQGDMGLATHSQLKNYFLADSDLFGVTGIHSGNVRSPYPVALVFWSVDDSKSFIHHITYSNKVHVPNGWLVEEAYSMLNRPQCQLFVRAMFEVQREHWDMVLLVRAGDVTSHSAYEGVFSRTVPRFDGFVFERRQDANPGL